MATARSTNRRLPAFNPPKGIKIWELGLRKNLNLLRKLIQPFSTGHFWVTSEAHEKHLANIRAKFEESTDPDGLYIIRHLMHTDENGECAAVLQMLLSLGVDPDMRNDDDGGYRPAHYATVFGRLELAHVLGACRPNLIEKNDFDCTPADMVLFPDPDDTFDVRQKVAQIGEFWARLLGDGFPKIAELAAQNKWWAVQALSRRRVISKEEAAGKYKGKDAVEWALHHGQPKMAAELQYLLPSSGGSDEDGGLRDIEKNDELAKSVETVKNDVYKINENFSLLLNKIREHRAELDSKISSLEAWREEEKKRFKDLEEKVEAAQAETQSNSTRLDTLEAAPNSVPELMYEQGRSGGGGDSRMHGILLGLFQELEGIALSGSLLADVVQDVAAVVKKHQGRRL